MEAELDQVDGRPIIGPERRLECLIAPISGLATMNRTAPISVPAIRCFINNIREEASIVTEKTRLKEIWSRLKSGNSNLQHLGLRMIDERFDLRGTSVPRITLGPSEPIGVGKAEARKVKGALQIVGARWNGLDFRGSDLRSLRVFDSVFSNCVFDFCECSDWRLWGVKMDRCSFVGANLHDSALGPVFQGKCNTYEESNFDKATLTGTSFQTAEFSGCTFRVTNLDRVNFQGSVFSDCVFEGGLRGTMFYDRGYGTVVDAMPANEMRNVNFARAALRWVAFRNLDLLQVEWPDDGEHLLVPNYRRTMRRLVEVFRQRSDSASRQFVAVFEDLLKWAGAHQEQGVLNKLDLKEMGGEAGMMEVVHLVGQKH